MSISINKRVIACTVGQSNSLGFDASTVRKANNGCPCQDPVPPNGSVGLGSWWPLLVEKLMRSSSIWLRVRNTAVGSTSIVQHWCGDTVGDGSGTPYNKDNGGFDPNGYLANALAEVNAGGTYDERWVFISIGQRDSVLDTSSANFQLGLENAINYFLFNGIKVALGFTCFKTGASTWYSTKGKVGYLAALVTFSGNNNVISGADLYTGIGESVELYDGDHMASRGYEIASDLWHDALTDGGW